MTVSDSHSLLQSVAVLLKRHIDNLSAFLYLDFLGHIAYAGYADVSVIPFE